MKVLSYYDGIPQWIEDLSYEEREKIIAEEEKKCAEMAAQIRKSKKQRK